MPDSGESAFWISKYAELRLTATPVLYHCEPIWSWKADSLPDFAIWAVLEGSGQLRRNGKSFSLTPGICFLFGPGEEIEAEQDLAHPLSLFVIRFQILGTNSNELSSDEIIGGMDEIKGKRIKVDGYLEEFNLSKEEADNLIMSARKIVFAD